MKTPTAFSSIGFVVFATLIAAQVSGQNPPTVGQAASDGPPNQAEMMKRMGELSKPGENHKLLASLAGTWNFTGKHFPMNADPNARPNEFKGSLVRKPIWEGRYLIAETTGEKLPMPWANGKEVTYQDMTMEGYDNKKMRFVRAMIDNHFDTGILIFEGTYDSASKTFTYIREIEEHSGTKTKERMLVKILDADHYTEEGFANRGAQEVKVTELKYTRVKGT